MQEARAIIKKLVGTIKDDRQTHNYLNKQISELTLSLTEKEQAVDSLSQNFKSMSEIRTYYQKTVLKLARDLDIFNPMKDDIKYN